MIAAAGGLMTCTAALRLSAAGLRGSRRAGLLLRREAFGAATRPSCSGFAAPGAAVRAGGRREERRAASSLSSSAGGRGAAQGTTGAPAPAPRSCPPKVGDVIRLTCDSLATGGEGVCRLDGGLVCFVHRGWPGEVFWARVTKVSKRFVSAVKTETIEGHLNAVTPLCKHFGPCGGCTLQSIEYDEQLKSKRRHVVDAVRRIGGLEDAEGLVETSVGSREQYGYRNKVEFSFSTMEWAPAEGCCDDPNVLPNSWVLGFNRPGHHDQVMSITSCALQGPAANRALAVVRREAQARGLSAYSPSAHTGILRDLVVRAGTCPDDGSATLLVQLVTRRKAADELRPLAEALATEVPEVRGVVASVSPWRGNKAKLEGSPELLFGSPVIMEQLLGLWFEVSAVSFFQTNPRQTEVLYALAGKEAELAEDQSDVVLDLYCGTGTIGLSLARRCRVVHGFEVNASAVEDAKRNAERNGISNAHFHQGDLEAVSRSIGSSVPAPDVVVTDPARAGMSPSVIKFLRSSGARRIVYISCNVTTQMRDVRDLAAPPLEDGEHSYSLRRVTPVDMFPQTAHIETVGVLDRDL